MGRVIMPQIIGGGVYSEELTASRAQVLDGYTAVTKDSGDEATEGTMVNRGAVSHSLAINGSYTIPQGYHNGSGKVTQKITTQGAKTYTPGTANQIIAAGRYLSGVQTIKGDANLKAANIKKGVTIFGVKGTWEGYVASNKDIYNRGAWGSGYSISSLISTPYSEYTSTDNTAAPNITYDSPCIRLSAKSGKQFMCGGFLIGPINLSAYSTINVIGNWESSSSTQDCIIAVYGIKAPILRDDEITSKSSSANGTTEVTYSLDISGVNQNAYVGFGTTWGSSNVYLVKRIYFT